MNAYYYLAIAICAEVIATVSMKAIKGFSTPLPLVLVIAGYATAFWMLTLVVRTIPVGVAYAVWAGMGIVMVSIAALFIYGQKLDVPAMLGMGLIVLVKLSAFTIGASTAGLAGVFFASYQGFVNPSSFTFFESALILAIVLLGGMGSTVGVVIAAFVLTVAPELLRSFSEYRVLLFGVLMVVMMIWRPRGLIRISRTGVTPRKGVAP